MPSFARICCGVTGRPGDGDGTDVGVGTTSPGEAASSGAGKGIRRSESYSARGADTFSLEWANKIMVLLWPYINKAVQKIVHEQVGPSIQEQMPGMLKGLHFETFTLGEVTPVLGPIKVYQRLSGGVQIVLGMNYQSDVDIRIKALATSIGIKSMSMEGDLHMCLEHLIEESPVVSGVLVYFLDPPKIDFKLQGVGCVADVPGFAGIVRSTVEAGIADALVLPNCFPVPLVGADQGVDLSLLKQPKPVGVLRVFALRGSGLMASDYSLLGPATSDAYVKITLADDIWRSSTVDKNLDPVWGENDFHDFLIYNREQTFAVEVFDEDFGKSDDHIGHATGIKVGSALENSEVPLTLYHPRDPNKTCGTLELKFEWLQRYDKMASDICIVVVKIDAVFLPHELGSDALVRARIGRHQKQTALVKQQQTAAVLSAVSQAVAGVVKRCDKEGYDHSAIARIAGISTGDVSGILSKDTDSFTRMSNASNSTTIFTLDVERTLYFQSTKAQLATDVLELYLVNGKGSVMTQQNVNLASVLADPCLRSAPVVTFEVSDSGTEIAAQIQVSIQGLKASSNMDIPVHLHESHEAHY